MTRIIRTDRSRIITHQRCARARWLEYHEAGTGITSARKPLPLAVGGAVHAGLAILLREAQSGLPTLPDASQRLDEAAVKGALADFAQFALALDAEQAEARLDAAVYSPEQLAAMRSDFDRYLYAEQSALVEALVRAYARRRLRPLVEEFEVLEVEREGEWTLADESDYTQREPDDRVEIRFMSRPDALLRERSSGQLLLLSFKTAASWDVRKARDIEHDFQGLSEGVEVERRLVEWHRMLHNGSCETLSDVEAANEIGVESSDVPTVRYLRALPTPPRIHAIRYEYPIKGERWQDKDLAARFGFDARSQKSHLIRRYVCVSEPRTSRGTGGAARLGDVCWSWEFHQPDGTASKLAWQNWRSEPVWESGPGAVTRWIDQLDAIAPTMSPGDASMGLEPREMGFGGAAQSLGFTSTHPLDDVFLPPVTVYRQDDDLRDWLEQTEAAERRVAESVAVVSAAADEGERRSLLNQHFPQSRHSCEYPSTCGFVKICYGGEDIRLQPLASGLYKRRIPNHPQERGDMLDAHEGERKGV